MGKIPKLKGDKKYLDAPRHLLIYDYEGEFKKNYSHTVKVMTTELTKKLISYTK